MVPLLTIVDLKFFRSGPCVVSAVVWWLLPGRFANCIRSRSPGSMHQHSLGDAGTEKDGTRFAFLFRTSVKPYGSVTSHIFSFCFGGIIYFSTPFFFGQVPNGMYTAS